MRNVFAGLLTAEARRGKNLCGIRKLQGIEGGADALHGGEIGFGKHFGHHALFFFADAVFAGDGAARGEAKVENFHRKRESAFFLAGNPAVVENEWVEIAVAGVKNIGDAQAGLLTEPRDFSHHLRKGGAGNHAVLDDVVGRDAAHGGEGRFAAFPNERALGVGLRDADFPRALRKANFIDVGEESFDFGERAIELDEQKAAAIGIVRVDGGFGGLDGEVVHHFDGGGKHAGSDDAADGGTGFVGGRECGEESANALGALHDAESDFGGNAESAFGADEDAGEIVAGHVERFPAEVHERTIGENDFDAEDVRRGEAVLEAMRSAGIFRDVAADGANGLRGGIGSIEIFVGLDTGGDLEIDDAGFDDNAGVGNVDFEDAIHAREAEDDAVFDGERAAAEAGTGAARDEGNLLAMADADYGLDLFSRRGKQYGAGQDTKIREAVAFVRVEFLGRGDEAAVADDGAEFVEDGGAAAGGLGRPPLQGQEC